MHVPPVTTAIFPSSRNSPLKSLICAIGVLVSKVLGEKSPPERLGSLRRSSSSTHKLPPKEACPRRSSVSVVSVVPFLDIDAVFGSAGKTDSRNPKYSPHRPITAVFQCFAGACSACRTCCWSIASWTRSLACLPYTRLSSQRPT